MKVTKVEEQGLRLVLSLARSGGRSTLHELAAQEQLSPPLVAKIVGGLRRGHIVRAIRGRNGCYALARPPEEITVADVLRAFGASLLRGCFNGGSNAAVSCPHGEDCSLRPVWLYVEARVSQVLDQITVSDLLKTEGEVRRDVVPLWPATYRSASRLPSIPADSRLQDNR